MELGPDYSETFVLPPCVEDWVEADHPARFIREYVDRLDLAAMGMSVRRSNDGRPNYSGAMLLKLWLLAYYMRVRSSRKLEAACRDSMGAIWLAGRLTPDHNTLWRFWSKNRFLIENVFRHSVKVAATVGLVGMVFHALDGTKILSAGSRHSALHKKDLEKLLAQLEEKIAQIARQVEEAQEHEAGSYRLELHDAQERCAAIEKALGQLHGQGIERMQPHDPDSKMMMANRGRVEWAYNAQVVVDDMSNIVVAADVSDCPADDHNLKPMLDQVQEQMGAVAGRTLADSSYGHSEEELALVQEAGYPVVTARPKQEEAPLHVSRFAFDRPGKSLTCPLGQRLHLRGTLSARDGSGGRMVFVCKVWDTCAHKGACCTRGRDGKPRRREIWIGPHHESATHQREVVDRQTRRLLMHRRMATVEPWFGRLKWLEGFTRFAFCGREKVRTQWRMLALTSNLRVLKKLSDMGLLRMAAVPAV